METFHFLCPFVIALQRCAAPAKGPRVGLEPSFPGRGRGIREGAVGKHEGLQGLPGLWVETLRGHCHPLAAVRRSSCCPCLTAGSGWTRPRSLPGGAVSPRRVRSRVFWELPLGGLGGRSRCAAARTGCPCAPCLHLALWAGCRPAEPRGSHGRWQGCWFFLKPIREFSPPPATQEEPGVASWRGLLEVRVCFASLQPLYLCPLRQMDTALQGWWVSALGCLSGMHSLSSLLSRRLGQAALSDHCDQGPWKSWGRARALGLPAAGHAEPPE